MAEVICEEAKAGRCASCFHGREPHTVAIEVTRDEAERHIECTTPSKCWHAGKLVRCVPVEGGHD